MLTKRSNGVANGPRLKKALAGVIGGSMDRRTFLKRSGLTARGAALAAATPVGMAKRAKAQAATAKISKINKIQSNLLKFNKNQSNFHPSHIYTNS